jgi:hypothetical protein
MSFREAFNVKASAKTIYGRKRAFHPFEERRPEDGRYGLWMCDAEGRCRVKMTAEESNMEA